MSGRVDLVLSISKLESWADALNRLDAGEDVAWMEWGRGAFHLDPAQWRA
ncbi:DUF5959 family protein [Streptomyces sp. NPDC006923]